MERKIGGLYLNDLRYADDIVIITAQRRNFEI